MAESAPSECFSLSQQERVRERERGRGEVASRFALCLILCIATGSLAATQSTNSAAATKPPAATQPTPPPAEVVAPTTSAAHGLYEAAFRIVAERNIFNANRSGGQVRISSSRRPARVESFTLVGTMAYAKGAFAFFSGTSSELSKTIKAGGVIAGHKIVDVLANAVKLEADGKILELPIGSAMRREDEGTWHLGEAVTGSSASSYASGRGNGQSSRSSRSNRSSSPADPNETTKLEKQDTKELKLDSKMESDVLKRLMERREKDSQ